MFNLCILTVKQAGYIPSVSIGSVELIVRDRNEWIDFGIHGTL